VECKTAGDERSEHRRKFNSVSKSLMKSFKNTLFKKEAWKKGFRTEVCPAKHIEKNELEEFDVSLNQRSYGEFVNEKLCITNNIALHCVPRNNAPTRSKGLRTGEITITDRPTQAHYRNMYVMIHEWPSISIQARRQYRSLLAKARKKLRHIPRSSIGMICLQTYRAEAFLPDLEKLVSQDDFKQIPLVWLNPFNEGKIICRTEHITTRNKLFKMK